MTKLEELKATRESARVAAWNADCGAAFAAGLAASNAADAAYDAELKKTQENSND